MAAPQDLIDAVISDDDGTDPTSLSAVPRRNALARKLHQMNTYVHNYRAWEWTFVRDTITLETGEDRAPLHDDMYMEFSRTGGAWRRDTGSRLYEMHRRFVENAR